MAAKSDEDSEKKVEQLERRIDFYHIVGRGKKKDEEFDCDAMRGTFAAVLDKDRVIKYGLTSSIAAWDMTEAGDHYQSFKCGKASNVDFGDLIKDGRLLDWQPQQGEQSIHLCHCVFFDNKVIGIEYNHKAPTARQIEHYFREKASLHHQLVLAVGTDFEEELKRAGTVNLFEFTIGKDHISDLEPSAPGLAAAMQSALDVYGAGTIRIEMRLDKNDPTVFNDRMVADITKWIKDPTGRAKKALKFARYRGKGAGDDDESHFVDLFKDKISERVNIDLDEKGNVDYVSAYNAIVGLYQRNEKELADSYALWLTTRETKPKPPQAVDASNV